MRFFIACDTGLEEVIGEPVAIDKCPSEVFAVHRAAIGSPYTSPHWRVSHVETGLSVSMGDTIDFAIQLAQEQFASKTPDEISKSLRKGRSLRKDLDQMFAKQAK